MKKTHIIFRSADVQFISSEKLLPLIRRGEVTYIEFEEFIYFHYTFVKVLQMLRLRGKPLVVHIRSIDNNVFSLELVREALSHFGAVNYIVEDKKGDFTIDNTELALFSNTYVIGKDINSHSEELIDRRRSYYHTSLKRVSLSFPKYLIPEKLSGKINEYKKSGKSVALVTGIFDVLHPGHISFLEKAKRSADIVIVLINSDLSTNHQPKNREHDRPVHRLHERVGVLNALKFITHIVPFDTDTALPILERLPAGIIYVKTVRDKHRKSIQKEIAAVKNNGGKTVLISNLRNRSGSVISSTMLITACRKKATSEEIYFDKEWSVPVQESLQVLINAIMIWNMTTGTVSRLREELRSRYDGSLKTAISTEQDIIDQINDITETIIGTLPEKKNYYWYVIPYLLGKLLDFPIKIFAVQYNKPGEPVCIINVVQRLGGKVVFFDVKEKSLVEPIVFEKQYWFIEGHYQYVALKHNKKFYIRVFSYPPAMHFSAISIKILLEDHKHTLTEESAMTVEITKKISEVWQAIEGIPFDTKFKTNHQEMSVVPTTLPGVIAHGGAAILSKDKFAAENSAAGIKYALEAGIDAVEIDINACKDGWVVMHEYNLKKETEIEGFAADFTEKQLKQVRLKFAKGKISRERIITLADALQLVMTYKRRSDQPIVVKVDIKSTNPKLERKLVEIIKKSGIPPEKVLITSKLVTCSRRLHNIYSKFAYEFNAVDSNMFLNAYSLMDNTIMVNRYVDYFVFYAPFLSTRVVSLAQFVINGWGDEISQIFIKKMHAHDFQIQVWVASSEEEYFKDARLGADYVQLQDPELITKILAIKKNASLSGGQNVTS
jgi:cytidyltransferase-like protein